MPRPIVELHSHLEGTIGAPTLVELAKDGRDHLLPTTDPARLASALAMPGYEGFRNYFHITRPFRFRLDDVRRITEAELARAHALGVVYAEYRFNPMGPARRGTDPWRVLSAVTEMMTEAERKTGLESSLLFGMARDDGLEAIEGYLDMAAEAWKEGLICGVDLNGNEKDYPTHEFVRLFSRFRRTGCPFVVHAGEWDGPDSVLSALECGASRIGHGTRSIEDNGLVDILARDGITLEICPTSNVYTGVFDRIGDVPVRRLADRGVAVTVSSDDSAAFGTDIGSEYRNVEQTFGFTPLEMESLVLNAIEGSFLPGEHKRDLVRRVAGPSNQARST